MKIAIIWKNDYPWDVRIEKFALSLTKAKHEVFILCSNKGCKSLVEAINGIEIRRLPCSKMKILNNIISSPFYLNPFWLFRVFSVIKKNKIDLIIVRDLPLVLIGLIVKKIFKIPVIIDMAEDYPALYMSILHKGGVRALKSWFLKNPYLMRFVEDYALKKVDQILVVVNESKDRITKKVANENKISIVSNTPNLMSTELSDKCIIEQNINNFVTRLMYCGFIQKARGLDTIIDSLDFIIRDGINIKISIIGDGYYLNELKEKVFKKGLSNYVEFKGWIKNNKLMEYLSLCDIGVIPHLKDNHTDTTVPNKLFDFMAYGKPVIVSNTNPMRRIVEEEDCGVVFKSGNAEDLAYCIKKIATDINKMNKLGENGRLAVIRRYNWEADTNTLLTAINKLIPQVNITKNV